MNQVRKTITPPLTTTLADGTAVTRDNGAYIIAQPDGRNVRIQRSQTPAFLAHFLFLYDQWRGHVDTLDLELRRTPDGLRIGDDAGGILIARSQLNAFLDALIAMPE